MMNEIQLSHGLRNPTLVVQYSSIKYIAFYVRLNNLLFIFDGEVTAGRALIAPADRITDLLILRLLHGRLVVLRASAHEALLDEIYALVEVV